MFSLYERPSESNNQQVLYIPQAATHSVGLCTPIKCMQLFMELIFVEQMDQLTAMKLHSVDQKYCVIDARNNGRVRFWKTAGTILVLALESATNATETEGRFILTHGRL